MKPKHLYLDRYEYRGYIMERVKRGSWNVYDHDLGINFVIKSGLTKAQAVAFIDERYEYRGYIMTSNTPPEYGVRND
tara:strand:+ start:115 stop:345 length:231 start_codon:yes stop_codon:yes gene_type:complete